MRGVLTIYRRELAGLFLAPLAWILLFGALGLAGWMFAAVLSEWRGLVTPSLQYTMGASISMFFLLVFLPPLLTMRMISEESRTGMLEFLLTAPVSDRAVVAGKFLAAASFMAVLWSSKLLYGLLLAGLGTPPDWPPVLGGYLGLVLISSLFCGVGVLASACTGTPLLAAFLGFVVNVLALVLPGQVGHLGRHPWVERLVELVDIPGYFEPFLGGVIDTASLVFFVAWTLVFLFLATRVVEMRRWR